MIKLSSYRLFNYAKLFLLKRTPLLQQAKFVLPMTNLVDTVEFIAKKQDFAYSATLGARYALHNLVTGWFEPKKWRTIKRERREDKLVLTNEDQQWAFSLTDDHWTTLSGLLRAAELNVGLQRSEGSFVWSDGEVTILLRDGFLLSADVSTVRDIFYDEMYDLQLDILKYF